MYTYLYTSIFNIITFHTPMALIYCWYFSINCTSAVVRLISSWWRAEKLPETCRAVVATNKQMENYSASVGFIHTTPLSSVYLIVLLFSALRFVSSYSVNMFSPVQNTQSVPVRSATRLPTLQLPMSVSFLSEKFKMIKFYCLFQSHQSNMFMYRHTSCTYL